MSGYYSRENYSRHKKEPVNKAVSRLNKDIYLQATYICMIYIYIHTHAPPHPINHAILTHVIQAPTLLKNGKNFLDNHIHVVPDAFDFKNGILRLINMYVSVFSIPIIFASKQDKLQT